MKRVTYLRNWSSRVKNAAVAALFLASYTIGSIAPFIPKAYAAPPVLIDASTHAGQESPAGTWTTGNVTTYKEGDLINFRFTVNAPGAASGQLGVSYSGLGSDCLFFDGSFVLGSVDNISGTSPSVTTAGSPVAGGGKWLQALNITFTAAGGATVNYTLKLSQEARECNGSSQGSQLVNLSGDVKNLGQMTVPVPANQIIELPEIRVEKWVDTDGDGQVDRTATAGEWSFSLDGGTPVATDASGQVVFTNVTPDGAHTVTETNGPTDQTFLGGSGTNCTFNGAAATATVASGTTATDATCVFNNTMRKGHIIVKKVTVPASDTTTSFGFTPSWGTGFSLTNGATKDSGELVAGTYNVSETAMSGWDLTSAVCSDGSDPSAIDLAAGETVTCTFTNIQQGKLIVQKTTNPSGSTQQFSVSAGASSGEIVGSTTGTVTDAADYTYTVKPGTFSVSEAVLAGWSQTGNTCTNVAVAAGETKTCLITNTKLARLTIIKDTVPNDAQDFVFTTTGTGLSGFSLDDDSDPTLSNQKQFVDLAPGAYTVTESSTPGWQLTGLLCDTNNFTANGAQVGVQLAAGQETTCTYTNSKLVSLGGYKYEVNADNSIVTPASGWIITLFKDGMSTGQTQTTGADGSYSFGSLLPGDYSVSETLLGGWTQVYNPLSPVSLAAGQTATDQNFGNFKNGSISGYKFNDHNGNGVEDSGDEHLSGWTISLAKEADSTMTLITYVATDGDGNYSFTNLAPGTYWICETGKTGWVQTYPTNNACHKVIIDMSGEQNTAVKFGNQGKGTITVQKNVDADGDGQVDYTNVGDWQWDAGGADAYATDTSQTFAAGLLTLTEAQKANYHFTSVICSDDESGVEVVQAESFDIILAPGQNITCVFTNTRDMAFVKVTKNIYPTDDQGLFNLLVDGTVKKQDVTNGDATDWVRVVTGSHSLSEVAGTATDMSHYDSRYTCWQDYREGMTYNSDLPAFGDGTSVDVSVATGQYVICNFYNERHATLTIEKDAEPNDSQDFNFTLWSVDMKGFRSESTSPLALQPLDFQTLDAPGTISPLESFVLDDDSDPALSNNASYELSGAWYGVTEDATDGWDLTNITCGEGENENWYVDDTTGVLYIWLEPGSDNSCTFTNTKRAHVTVHKDAQPDYAQAFNFTTDLTGESSSFSLTDNGVSAALASSEFANVVPGTYTVTEDAVSGWTLSGVSCTGAEMLRDGAKITIDVQPGADVDCTFVNQKNTIPQVLGETTQPKLEDTGSSIWVAIGMSLSVMGLALLTVTSGRRRDQWTGLVD